MTLKRIITFTLAVGLMFPQVGFTQTAVRAVDVQRFLVQAAVNGDTLAVQTAVRAGYPIDSVDFNGNTALCLSVWLNNAAAYNILKENGADTEHDCTKRIPPQKAQQFCPSINGEATFCQNVTDKSGSTWKQAAEIGGTAVLAGGLIAAVAASGGSSGGGGSDDGTDDDTSTGGGDDGTQNPDGQTQDDCIAGQYWNGNACVDCGEGATSDDKSNACVCTDGTWNASTNTCDAVEKVAEKIVACLGGVWNEITGKCTCAEGMSLIGGVCIQPLGDTFQETDVQNTAEMTLDDQNTTALLAEVGAKAENTGTITGVSDKSMTGIRVAGVATAAAVDGAELTKESEIDLSQASQGINTGTINLSHASTAGQSLYGIHATTGAGVANSGEIVINSKSKQESYGVYIEGGGQSFDNTGTITLNVGGQTEKIYGIAADDRNVTNSGTIDVALTSDFEDVVNTKSAIAGMQGGTLTNNGIVNFDTSALTGKVGANFTALSLAPFGTAINETDGKINLNISNVVGRIAGLQTMDGATTGTLINKGEINIAGSLYRDTEGSTSVFGMYQQNGKLQNFGTMTADLDTTAGGQMFFMKNVKGDVTNEDTGVMKIDLVQTADSVNPVEIAALATATGTLTNKGQIIIDTDLNGFQSDGTITAMNAEGSGNASNAGLIHMVSNADYVSLYGMSAIEGRVSNTETGVIKLETTGKGVDLSSMTGKGGSARNDGTIILNHFGSGSINASAGGNAGNVTVNTKDGEFLSIVGFASIGTGVVQEKDATTNLNLFGNTVSTEGGLVGAGGIIGFKSTGTTENAGTTTIRTNDGYLSGDEVAAVLGDASLRRNGENFGHMFGMLQEIGYKKTNSGYKGVSMKNSGLVNIQADGQDSDIYGMATLKGFVAIDDTVDETTRDNLLHGRIDPSNVSSLFSTTHYGVALGGDSGDRWMGNSGTLNIETKTDTSVIGMLGAQDTWTEKRNEEVVTVLENSIVENTGHITITALGDNDKGTIVSFDQTPAFIPYSVIGMATNSSIKGKDEEIVSYGATNKGSITINVTGDTRAAGMVAWGNGAAINKGTIEINHKDGINDATSAFATAWGPQLVGCYAANGGVCVNEGTIRINGSVTDEGMVAGKENFDWDSNSRRVALSAGDSLYAVSGTGTLDATGYQLTGEGLAPAQVTMGSNATKVVLSGQGAGALIGNGDNSELSFISGSALYDVALVQNTTNKNGLDIHMTMKPFEEMTENKSLADFLTMNYAKNNNGAFFDDIKAIGSTAAFSRALNSLTGADTIARFTREDLSAMRELNQSMNNLMFANNDKSIFKTQGTLNGFGFKNDSESSAQYTLSNKRISQNMKIGYAVSKTVLDTEDGNDTTRRNSVFQVFMPISYNKSGWQMIATPQLGYARAHYSRSGFNDTTYDGVIEKRMVALMNEARYPMTFGDFEIAPTVEFNAIAYNQKGQEDAKAYALTLPSDNNLSIEAGLGLHAAHKMGPLDLTAGLMVYKEFADPYNIKMGMDGMDGTFSLYDNVSPYRGTASFGFNYNAGDMSMYGNVQHFMESETHTNVKTGLKYVF